MAQDPLRLDRDGRVWLALRRPWSDGTTHLTFDPVDLLGRLAVLIPRPRVNLVLYYGVLAPRAPWRTAVVGPGGCDRATACDRGASGGEASGPSRARRPGPYRWADLMRRTFGFDVLACPRCGGRLRLLALIEHASTVDRILRHLGLPTAVPEPRPARAPPAAVESADLLWADAPTA
jgi:hypothetical protein